jgi:putative acetyltransferase
VGEERRYLRALKRHPDAAVFVAEDDGAVVARLSVARDPHSASRHVADLGLMVDAGYRRRGIGRALLEQAVQWARESGVQKLELHVFPWNEPAIRLYEQFGFRREGLRVAHYRRDGDLVDVILMAYMIPR